MSQRSKVCIWDVEELAAHILGVTEKYEDSEDPSRFIDDELFTEFSIDTEILHALVERLLPLITIGKSILGGQMYKGFADAEGGRWLVKGEAA